MKKIFLVVVLLIQSSLAFGDAWTDEMGRMAKSLNNKNQNQVFEEYLTKFWTHLMITYPDWATYVGFPGQNDRLTDNSLAFVREQKKMPAKTVEFLGNFKRDKLNAENQVTYDILLDDAKNDALSEKFPGELLALNQMNNEAQGFASLLKMMPTQKAKDFEDALARLRQFPTVLSNNTEALREGLKAKVTPPKITLAKIPAMLKGLTPTDVTKSPYYMIFAEIPATVAKEDALRIQKEAQEILKTSVYPAVKAYANFVEKEYIPNARMETGMSSLPNGKEWYDLNILKTTTVKLTADQIHEIGLKEVERLYAAMDAVRKKVGFKGDMKKFMNYVANDKKFRFKNANEMVETYRSFGKVVDAKLPLIFRTLPRNTWGIEEVPAFMAKAQAAAYYEGGSLATGRPGIFFLNTSRPSEQHKWETESLTMHEAVPGHHFQISLAQEMNNMPEIRRHNGYTAYTEGWGLYAETLGYEMGLYKDPYSEFGQLTNEIWRACRLVVDTGMHAKNWTRQQAIDFMKKYLAKTEEDITVEVDRYLVWPGQALAYKIGQLKIRELRDRATRELGDKFQVRDFHDQVLLAGSLPLTVLEKRIETWITSQKTDPNRKLN